MKLFVNRKYIVKILKHPKSIENKATGQVVTDYSEDGQISSILQTLTNRGGVRTTLKFTADGKNGSIRLSKISSSSSIIAIPESVVDAEGNTYEITSLKKGMIDKNVTEISLGKVKKLEKKALLGCKNLVELVCGGEVKLGKNSLKGTSDNLMITVSVSDDATNKETKFIKEKIAEQLEWAGNKNADVKVVKESLL